MRLADEFNTRLVAGSDDDQRYNGQRMEQLLSVVLSHISEDEQASILRNLELIRYGGGEVECIRYDYGPLSITTPITIESGDGRCRVCFTLGISSKDATLQYGLAHELAHVFFNHPYTGKPERVACREAHAKARKWGFEPDPSDKGRIKHYQEWETEDYGGV